MLSCAFGVVCWTLSTSGIIWVNTFMRIIKLAFRAALTTFKILGSLDVPVPSIADRADSFSARVADLRWYGHGACFACVSNTIAFWIVFLFHLAGIRVRTSADFESCLCSLPSFSFRHALGARPMCIIIFQKGRCFRQQQTWLLQASAMPSQVAIRAKYQIPT